MLLSACSACKVAKSSPIQEIRFGHGGGFTGAVRSYTLKSDGTIWQQDKQIKKIPCDSLSAIFELVEELPQADYVHPGNTYHFVRINMPDKKYNYTWSPDQLPDRKVVELYFKLNKQL